MSLRVVFMGTPDYAVPSLESLFDAGYKIVGVFCQPDRASGRGKKVRFGPVKQWAMDRGLSVFQPARMRGEGVEILKNLQPDLCVTAAFGQILPKEALDIPKMGTVNVHASLLPEYRGSSPVNWCLINGETVTGVTTMLTDKGIDTGDILLKKEVEILPEDGVPSLTQRLAEEGAKLLLETIDGMLKGSVKPTPQDESQATYYPMLTKDMGKVDWNLSAQEIVNRARGLSPWPGYSFESDIGTIKIISAKAIEKETSAAPAAVLAASPKEGLQVATGKGILDITHLQLSGSKAMAANDFLRGRSITQIK
jgi:methionyl-tRNA formyltransferase